MNCSNLKNDLFKLHVADSPSQTLLKMLSITFLDVRCVHADKRINLIADLSEITEVDIDVILHEKEELLFEDKIKIFQAVHETTSERFSI